MIDWVDVFLGLLQGITEFLPISSSGHLFVLEKFFKAQKTNLSFILILHVASLLSICCVFFKDIRGFIFNIQNKTNLGLIYKILISLSPLIFLGLFFRPLVESGFKKNIVALGFLSSGFLLLSLVFIKRGNRSLGKMSFFQAFLIGLAQALAVFPGFSRSGWTIAVGLYCGLRPKTAVYYSFLISLPAIAGSAFVDWILYFSNHHLDFQWSGVIYSESGLSLMMSFLIAFLSGIISLLIVLRVVQKDKLYLFSFYLFPLALFVFLFL